VPEPHLESHSNDRPPMIRLIVGIKPPNETIALTFEGEVVRAWAGESLASAVMRAGHQILRRTRKCRAARGFFCGMGLCWECAVHVQGQGVVRACCHPAAEEQVVAYADEE